MGANWPREEVLHAAAAAPDLPPPPPDLVGWGKAVLPGAFSLAPSKFHHRLAADLDELALGGLRGQLLNEVAPRDSAKTTWTSYAFALREALEGREPYILLAAETNTLAWKYLRRVRDAVEFNPQIRAHYPGAAGRGPVWAHDAIELRNGCRIEARGTGANVRGSLAGDRRPTLIVGDDLQARETIHSALMRSRDWQWITHDLLSAGEPGHTNVVVLGTTLHRECIVCRLQSTAGWRSKVYRAVEAWPERMDLWGEWAAVLTDPRLTDAGRAGGAAAFYAANRAEMDRGAEVLWPEREPLEWLMAHRETIGPAAFNAEKMSDPFDPTTCQFLPEWFAHPLFWFDEWPEDCEVKVLALDPSKGAQDNPGDDSAFVRYGRTPDGWEWVEADLRNDRNATRIVDDGITHLLDFRPDWFAIEGTASQELFKPLFAAALAVRCPNADVAPVHLLENKVNKVYRIQKLVLPMAARRIRFKARSPGTARLILQLRDFPNGAHDDGPDALDMARRTAIAALAGKLHRRAG